jgi:hypothetical protein
MSKSEAWDTHRATIKRLYLDEGKTLPQVMVVMLTDHNFKASVKMYKRRLTSWKLDNKHLKRNQVKQIARTKVVRETAGKSTAFLSKGQRVDEEKVRQYVKKHGYSSLEEFDQAASPLTPDKDIVCYTPASSPSTPQAEEDEVDMMSIPLHPNTMASPDHHSRKVYSVMPVPHCLTQPPVFKVAEQLLWTFNTYLHGSFDAHAWITNSEGWLTSVSGSRPSADYIMSDCHTAVELVKQRKYVQARLLLSRACTKIERQVKSGSPVLIFALLLMRIHLRCAESLDIAAIITRHSLLSAEVFMGDQHPLACFLQRLLDLDGDNVEALLQLMQCNIDVLGRKVGPGHRETLAARNRLIEVVCPQEAVIHSRALVLECEKTCTREDPRRISAGAALAWALHRDQQYQEAESIMLSILDALEAAPRTSSNRSDKAINVHLLSRMLHSQGDLARAEHCSRLCVREAANVWGLGGADTIRYMTYHVELLRKLGRNEEAEEMEKGVEHLLGLPEIQELSG